MTSIAPILTPAGAVAPLRVANTAADIAALRAALTARLAAPATMPPLLLGSPDDGDLSKSAHRIVRLPPEVVAIVQTSGSTGKARKLVGLSASALLASALATLSALASYPHRDGHHLRACADLAAARSHLRADTRGAWIAGLPPHHIAGLQVITRAIVSDAPIITPDYAAGFHPDALADAAAKLPHGLRAYTSLVPTQVHRLLQPHAAASLETITAALDVAIVGGAPLAPALAARAAARGLHLVHSYGMSETCGGLVYDGWPLAGVEITFTHEAITLRGPMLTDGYLHEPYPRFVRADGRREIVTNDRGYLQRSGQLHVSGRLDDVIITGGENVAPTAVEAALAAAGYFGVVVGLPDPHWGELLTFVTTANVPLAALRTALADHPRSWRPRAVVTLTSLPEAGPGKINRRAVSALAREVLRDGGGECYGETRT
ncbi:MAG: AMP-binding protein [Bowdeniella nasicola]|nr:AMP-binding protein [Bowdeniella nasicola]